MDIGLNVWLAVLLGLAWAFHARVTGASARVQRFLLCYGFVVVLGFGLYLAWKRQKWGL